MFSGAWEGLDGPAEEGDDDDGVLAVGKEVRERSERATVYAVAEGFKEVSEEKVRFRMVLERF